MSYRRTGTHWKRKMRAALSDRDGACCRQCGVAEGQRWRDLGRFGNFDRDGVYSKVILCSTLAIDHVVELADGGTDDLGNLQLLCHICHLAKTVASKRARREPHA